MATDVTIETVALAEIHDLAWPTDAGLVQSFRKTLQHGGQFSPIQLNRVWQTDATWHHEVVDGFHRYKAAKAEHLESLLCQVVELDDHTARYARIRACLGKPSVVTGQRALLELQQAFVDDMRALIGDPEVLYEPILGENGQIQARQRSAPLPEDPYQALQALTDHLLATRSAYPAYEVRLPGRRFLLRTPFGQRTGWEQSLNEWLAEMAERFGYDAAWLLDLLHLQLFDDFLGPRRWYTRRGQPPFSEEQEYVDFALRLWQIPDVDLRVWFQRRLEERPTERVWLAKVQDLLQLNGFPEPGQTRVGPNKQEIFRLFTDYPSLYNLAVTLGKRQQETLPEPGEAPPTQMPAVTEHQPQHAAAAEQASKLPDEKQDSAIFAVVARNFANRPIPPAAPRNHISPSVTPEPVRAAAYQPVHVACQALLQAIGHLTQQYGREWLTWETAQVDLAQLRAALVLT
ncbi:MAG TPA: hypothetical protein VKT82_17085 [Ktedonobacterales bacterium]|nr:hypothetical protein [Ktedonobacterales bacterium]